MNYKTKIVDFVYSSGKRIAKDKLIGYALLLLSFLISLLHFQNGIFVDEEDNLLMGSLILKGMLPYRDIFSHHFPFVYFWTSLAYLFSNDSILLARLSVIAFQVIIFFISMRLSSNYLIFGIVSLMWSLIRNYYWGNMLLYHSLDAPLSASIFFLTYLLLSNYPHTWKYALILAGFSALLVLLTPFAVYGLFFLLLFLLLKEKRLFFQYIFFISVIFFLFFIYLIFTKSLGDFVDQAIIFNINIYNKYNSFLRNQTESGLFGVFNTTINLLDISSKDWKNWDLFKPLVLNYSDIDKWIFTGFHFRISWLLLFFYSLINRKYLAGIFSLFFGVSLLSIGKWGFHGQPFVMSSITASIILIVFILTKLTKEPSYRHLHLYIIGFPLLFMMGWLSIRLITNLDNPNFYRSYRDYYKEHIEISKMIKKWTCNKDDVKLVYYPAGYRQHFFTGLPPLTKYTAMYPWIAEIGQENVINVLQKDGIFVIVYIEPTEVWGREVIDYLSPLIGVLENNYIKIDDLVFVSPALYSICPVSYSP